MFIFHMVYVSIMVQTKGLSPKVNEGDTTFSATHSFKQDFSPRPLISAAWDESDNDNGGSEEGSKQ